MCPDCGERNPVEFPVCWKCHADLPDEFRREAPRPPKARRETIGCYALPTTDLSRTWLATELCAVLLLLWGPVVRSGLYYRAYPASEAIGLVDTLWNVSVALGSVLLCCVLLGRRGGLQAKLGWRWGRLPLELVWIAGLAFVMLLMSELGFIYAAMFGELGEVLERPPAPEPEPFVLWLQPLTYLVFALEEEVVARVYVWTRLTQLTGRPLPAIFAASALWSICHVSTLDHHLSLFFSGVVYGLSFWWSRSLPRLVFGHWLYNLLVTYVQ